MTDEISNHSTPVASGPEHSGEMSFLSHLAELRRRLIKVLIAFVALFLLSFSLTEYIIEFLKGPLAGALPEGKATLHFTGPLDVFIVNIKVAFLTATIFSSPVWLYQFWQFVQPALYPNERKYVLPFMISSIILFGSGVLFCYYLMLPLALDVLIGIGVKVGTPIITITDYVSLLMILIFAFGLIFETPLVLILLSLVGLIDSNILKRNRKYIIIGFLVIAAVLTPPDPISQVAMALPTYLMFEISIIIIDFITKKGRCRNKETLIEEEQCFK